MPESRNLRFFEAVREATELCMAKDRRVYVMGLGVPDPKGIFGTTLGLEKRFGKKRVMDMPASENGMTGVVLGSALAGMKPILTHQRLDFALLSMEQIVNQAAKWHYMFGGRAKAPLVIRLIVGRGWGQGPQHSQALHSWFAHVPGLKVVMPATPFDAKGLFISSVEDDGPVIFIEHRWLHPLSGPVPRGIYRVPIGPARILETGTDITIASVSYMTIEALRAAARLKTLGVSAEVVDVRTLRPLDDSLILKSVSKTGRLIVADLGWSACGFSSEIVSRVSEKVFDRLKCPPRRLTLPDGPTPTSPELAKHHYPRACHLVELALGMVEPRGTLSESPAYGRGMSRRVKVQSLNGAVHSAEEGRLLDVPDENFVGSF